MLCNEFSNAEKTEFKRTHTLRLWLFWVYVKPNEEILRNVENTAADLSKIRPFALRPKRFEYPDRR